MSVRNPVAASAKEVAHSRSRRTILTLANNPQGKASAKKQSMRGRPWTLVLACVCLGTLPAATAMAQKLPNQVTLAIGTAPGAAYDIAGRLVSRHLARHLPGSPPSVTTPAREASCSLTTPTMSRRGTVLISLSSDGDMASSPFWIVPGSCTTRVS